MDCGVVFGVLDDLVPVAAQQIHVGVERAVLSTGMLIVVVADEDLHSLHLRAPLRAARAKSTMSAA